MTEERIPVAQEDPLGCAVACVAFRLGMSYRDALKLFNDGEDRVKKKADFYCREIVQILNSQGLSYGYRYIKKRCRRSIYKPGSIVFIKRSKKYPVGHYLCRANNGWMDPWINIPFGDRKAGFRKRLPGIPTYLTFCK